MAASHPRRRVAATALSTPHFLLLYAAMLVAAAGLAGVGYVFVS